MIELRNQYGQIDLAAIDPAEVAKLDDNQQAALAALISAVQDREAATERFSKAVLGVRLATTEQETALAEHVAANPPQTFQQALAASVAAFNSH